MEGGPLNAVMDHDQYENQHYEYDQYAPMENDSDADSAESDESFGAQQRRNNF